MKLLKTIALLGTIFFLFLLVSCSEENEPVPTRTDLLAGAGVDGRSYFINSAEVDLADLNGTLILDECITDNTIIYYPNGRYEENEGRSKCDAEDLPGIVGSWTLINNESQLSVSYDNETEVWDILSINDNGHRLTRATEQGELTFVLERFL